MSAEEIKTGDVFAAHLPEPIEIVKKADSELAETVPMPPKKDE